MPIKNYKAEQIVTILRQIEVHGRQEQGRVTDAARREDRSGASLVSEPTGPGEGQRQMAQPHTCSPPGRLKSFFVKSMKPGGLGGHGGISCSTTR